MLKYDEEGGEFTCPHCSDSVKKTWEWLDDNLTGPCPHCGRTIDFEALEEAEVDEGYEAFIQQTFTKPPDLQHYWYMAPHVDCSKCLLSMALPYPNLPEIPQTATERHWQPEDRNLLELPSDEWSVVLGCRGCGHVDTYREPRVNANAVPHQSQGRYHDEAVLYCVEFPCGDRHCKAPSKILVDMRASMGYVSLTTGLPSHMRGETDRDLLQLIRRGHFQWKMPCGHYLTPVPEPYYKIHRVLDRLW
jgi:hypothetical protein